LNAGDLVLDALELGSKFTWDLAHADLLSEPPYYDHGPDTPYVSIFIGNQPYEGLASVANDPGTDGTVRWAGCALNTRKLRVDLTRSPVDDDGKPTGRIEMLPWADARLDIPMVAVEGKNHATLISDPDPAMVDLLVEFLRVGNPGAKPYADWLASAHQFGAAAREKMLANPGANAGGLSGAAKTFLGHLVGSEHAETLEGWQQFVVFARDERGDGVSDYVIEVLRKNEAGDWVPFQEMFADVHAYQTDSAYRCFHIRLPHGLSSGNVELRLRIHASTGTELMAYQGYGSETKQLTATSEPVELDIPTNGDGTLFYPFTTTLIEIVLNREPVPFDQASRILRFLPNS